jgi:hypothetical protein
MLIIEEPSDNTGHDRFHQRSKCPILTVVGLAAFEDGVGSVLGEA